MRFQVRSWLLLVLCLMLFSAIGYFVGWYEAVGIGVGIAAFVVSARWYARGRIVLASLAVLFGVAIAWFVVVDWSVFEDCCKDCGYRRTVFQYRVFGVPISEEERELSSPQYLVGKDMGVVCGHDFERYHAQRWWGLVYITLPDSTGMTLVDPNFHDERTAGCVRKMVSEVPSVKEEYRQRVFVEHDNVYFWSLMRQIRERRDLDSLALGSPADSGRKEPPYLSLTWLYYDESIESDPEKVVYYFQGQKTGKGRAGFEEVLDRLKRSRKTETNVFFIFPDNLAARPAWMPEDQWTSLWGTPAGPGTSVEGELSDSHREPFTVPFLHYPELEEELKRIAESAGLNVVYLPKNPAYFKDKPYFIDALRRGWAPAKEAKKGVAGQSRQGVADERAVRERASDPSRP